MNKVGYLRTINNAAAGAAICIASLYSFGVQAQEVQNFDGAQQGSTVAKSGAVPEVMCKNQKLISAGVALLTGGIGGVIVNKGMNDSCANVEVNAPKDNAQIAGAGVKKVSSKSAKVPNSSRGRTVQGTNVASEHGAIVPEQLTVLSEAPSVQGASSNNVGESIGAGVESVSAGLASIGKGAFGALSDLGNKLKKQHQEQASKDVPTSNDGFSPN